MIRYVVKRLLMMIPILLCISFFVMVLIDITPGDPARLLLGNTATEEKIESLREEWGLNDPLPVRYGRFVWNILHGDFGTSYQTKRPVATEMFQRFPYTLLIAVLSLVLSVFIGIPLGVLAATHQYTIWDNVAIFLSLIAVSMPGFWFALLLIRYFGVVLAILPTSGIEDWKGWILPTVSLALGYAAIIARQTRSNLLEVIRQDYITTARAKGLAEGRVLYLHAMKNAIIPVVMIVGSIFGASLGGALIAEIVFSVPGLGQYTLSGLSNRDYPVIQGSVLILSGLYSVIILVIDLLFALIDPRIRSQYSSKREKIRKKGGVAANEAEEGVAAD
ncbi:MAG: ABC transporter permease [Oscillospiraceae bacterium]|nr:ABC transporter permease [Oscillospiraceae bacterium]